MNTNITLRELLVARPFVPFQIEMAEGHVFHIPHPEFVALPPSSTERYNPFFLIWRKDGAGTHVNPLLVSRITQGPSRGKSWPRAGAKK